MTKLLFFILFKILQEYENVKMYPLLRNALHGLLESKIGVTNVIFISRSHLDVMDLVKFDNLLEYFKYFPSHV